MLNRRNFLMASVAAGVMGLSGVAVAAPAPSKLVGHSLRCMTDLYHGYVAVEDVGEMHVTRATLAAFHTAVTRYDAGHDYDLFWEQYEFGHRSVEVVRQLIAEDKFRVVPDGIPTLAWTRDGVPFTPVHRDAELVYRVPYVRVDGRTAGWGVVASIIE